ncbi:uncharacterized protein EHS24_000919 [Apiotrichum porosum]|uniref:Uncharacterized protein n=1 Tax=Apiotrichum porosum TaxID=105984 RepID=A0A427YB55_9TREE|nr:uncharacterized protein EHS24_000919 [Apiotrichum porosum]RSH88379.1 hypothetical protein EHS24_000919 [Apiotrichum porosum]
MYALIGKDALTARRVPLWALGLPAILAKRRPSVGRCPCRSPGHSPLVKNITRWGGDTGSDRECAELEELSTSSRRDHLWIGDNRRAANGRPLLDESSRTHILVSNGTIVGNHCAEAKKLLDQGYYHLADMSHRPNIRTTKRKFDVAQANRVMAGRNRYPFPEVERREVVYAVTISGLLMDAKNNPSTNPAPFASSFFCPSLTYDTLFFDESADLGLGGAAVTLGDSVFDLGDQSLLGGFVFVGHVGVKQRLFGGGLVLNAVHNVLLNGAGVVIQVHPDLAALAITVDAADQLLNVHVEPWQAEDVEGVGAVEVDAGNADSLNDENPSLGRLEHAHLVGRVVVDDRVRVLRLVALDMVDNGLAFGRGQ